MATKKHFFTKNHEKLGKNSVKIREKQLPQTGKQESKPGLPINPRSISDPLFLFWGKVTWQRGLIAVFCLAVVAVSSWQGILLGQRIFAVTHVLEDRVKLTKEVALWTSIASKYPSYRDAYFQVAVLSYRLGDTQTEQHYLAKTLELDPNFEPAQHLKNIVGE